MESPALTDGQRDMPDHRHINARRRQEGAHRSAGIREADGELRRRLVLSATGVPALKAHVTEFLRIADDVDRDDAAAVMLERKGIDRTVFFTPGRSTRPDSCA
jgi:hypothetical protein